MSTPVRNLVCPACRGPVVASNTVGTFTGIYQDGGAPADHEFYDQATPFQCVTPECDADEFFMGTKLSEQEQAT